MDLRASGLLARAPDGPLVSITMTDERREQIAKQCDAVAHMATILAGICRLYAASWREGEMEGLEDIVGARTTYQMDVLGNMLNSMDAIDETDAWMEPIFAAAHRLWPHAIADAS